MANNILLDGDECITGLMAKHFSEGNGIPWFFYGQSYGFSFIEIVFISISYLFLGVSDIAVKLSMLSLWVIGIVFFYKSLKHITPNEKWLPFIFALLFITSPSWFIWSMKARGGYLTAFTAFTICTWIFLNIKEKRNNILLFLSGCLIVIIYQAQPLWLPCLIPVTIYYIIKTKIKHTAFIFLGITITIVFFYFIKLGISTFWSAPKIEISNINFDVFGTLHIIIFHHLTGSYFYNNILPSGVFANLWAIIFEACMFFSFIAAIIALIIKKSSSLLYIFSISVLLTFGFIFFETEETPRYLLPLTGCALFMFYSVSTLLKNKIIIYLFSGFLLITGVISLFSINNDYGNANRNNINHLAEELQLKNIKYVYSKDGLLQWQIIFYTKEKTIARYLSLHDRYPEYIKIVDEASEIYCDNTAIVGYYFTPECEKIKEAIIVDDKFYIYKCPGKGLLIDNGFEIKVK